MSTYKKGLTVWKKEEVAIPQRDPDNVREEVSICQSDLEHDSEVSTLQRTLVVCLRECPRPHLSLIHI